MRSGAAKRKAIEEQIVEESRLKQRATMTIGTVTMLRDNGITINDNPQAAITVTYLRADGTTAQVETTEVVPRLEVPPHGDPATVWYDPSTGDALASSAARDHTARRRRRLWTGPSVAVTPLTGANASAIAVFLLPGSGSMGQLTRLGGGGNDS